VQKILLAHVEPFPWARTLYRCEPSARGEGVQISSEHQLHVCDWGDDAVASPAMGHWDTCPPRLPTISFLVHPGVNLTASCPVIV